jgi:hypothetical protein
MTIGRPGELLLSLGVTDPIVRDEKATKQQRETLRRKAMIMKGTLGEDRNQRRVRAWRTRLDTLRTSERPIIAHCCIAADIYRLRTFKSQGFITFLSSADGVVASPLTFRGRCVILSFPCIKQVGKAKLDPDHRSCRSWLSPHTADPAPPSSLSIVYQALGYNMRCVHTDARL